MSVCVSPGPVWRKPVSAPGAPQEVRLSWMLGWRGGFVPELQARTTWLGLGPMRPLLPRIPADGWQGLGSRTWPRCGGLARCLLGVPRWVYRFNLQELAGLDVCADTGWGGMPGDTAWHLRWLCRAGRPFAGTLDWRPEYGDPELR